MVEVEGAPAVTVLPIGSVPAGAVGWSTLTGGGGRSFGVSRRGTFRLFPKFMLAISSTGGDVACSYVGSGTAVAGVMITSSVISGPCSRIVFTRDGSTRCTKSATLASLKNI